MQVSFFTKNPFTVEHNSQLHALDKSDVNKIILATVVGSLFFLIGGLFAFLGASYYFRQKKVQQLTEANNPHLQRISQVRDQAIPFSNPGVFSPSSLKAKLINEMDRTLGAHLKGIQRNTLLSLFDQALQTPQPRQTLEALINGKINQPDGWGMDKAAHIRNNLLSLLPDSGSANAQVSPLKALLVREMDRTLGAHLKSIQRNTLLSLFDQALQTPQPRQALEALINGKINHPDGWGMDKAAHIRNNLLPLLPMSNTDPSAFPSSAPIQQTQVRTIAQTPINPQGAKLVCFYKSGPTEFLGNFANCPHGIQIWGHTFKCSEAAFQWRKYYLAAQSNHRLDLLNDPKMQEFFTCDGERAFRLNQELGRNYPNVFASNWINGVRDQAMWEVLNAKFQQNPELTQLLQDTQGAYLLEHNQAARDNYWSDNSNGTGKNMLGKMLMAIRDGKPCPPPNDASDQSQVQAYANYANQPRALSYQIF